MVTAGLPAKGFGLSDTLNSLEALHRLPARIRTEFHESIALARRFIDEVVRPVHMQIDRSVMEDNDFLPVDVLRQANEWGLFTRWVPKMFGGKGKNMLSLYPCMEEISSVCAGLANLIGVHYLGVSVLCSSGNARVINRILRDVASQEKKGNPCIISLAWTEPGAGTDQCEGPLLDRAKVRTSATRVAGGYRVNGSKVFISAGHLCTWHMAICYEDLKRPADTLMLLAVKTGTDGFSFGHKEHKMGQKACVASELIFEDCFVPEENVCFSTEHLRPFGINANDAVLKFIGMFPAVSQPGVGAVGTGVARGAWQTAMGYAASKRAAGERLIDQEWAQLVLADMYTNVVTSRTLYMEAAYAVAMKSMIRMLFDKRLFYLSYYLPRWFFTLFVSPWFNLGIVNRLYRQMTFVAPRVEDEKLVAGIGSLSKVACSDLAMRNSEMALDLMGADGTRHEFGAEKFLRDAKLLQIYEGTNEINRINLFLKNMAPGIPDVRVFE